jgi:hypothetical protein
VVDGTGYFHWLKYRFLRGGEWIVEDTIPQSYGAGPNLTADPAGRFHVVWSQKMGALSYDVFYSQDTGTGLGIEPEIRPGIRSLTLRGNWPNPFRKRTRIAYSTSVGTAVKLRLYNFLGERLTEWNLGYLGPGSHEFLLDMDVMPSRGHGAQAGVYFYHLVADQAVGLGKLLVMD